MSIAPPSASPLSPARLSRSPFLIRHLSRLLLTLLLLLNLSVKLGLAADPHLHLWDERFHALVAKNLLQHPLVPTLYDHPALPYDYRQWNANHFWVHKPPMTLWLMAASMAVLGPTEFAARLPSVLLSTLAILLTYLIARRLFPPDPQTHPSPPALSIPLLAALFHALHGFLITLSAGFPATDHTDSFFTFFVELGVYLAILSSTAPHNKSSDRFYWRELILGVALALALLTKWFPAVLILVVFLALHPVTPLRRLLAKLILIAIVAAALVLPWHIYIHHTFPLESAWEQAYNVRHLTEVLESQARSPHQYILDLLGLYSYLAPIPIAAFLISAFRHPRHRALGALALWFLIPYLVFTCVATKMPAYVMIAAPAIFLMEAWFCACLLALYSPRRPLTILAPALAALLVALTAYQSATMVFRPIRANRWTWMDADYRSQRQLAADLKQLSTQIHDPSAVLFNVPHPIEAMFYTPFTAYPQIPTPQEIAALKTAHRPLIVLDDAQTPISPALRTDPQITLLRIPRPL